MKPQKGARPHIDIDKLPNDCCETRVIRVKIRPDLENTLRNNRHKKSRQGYVKTGHASFDRACQRIRGRGARQLIEPLYQRSPRSQGFVNRHRDWEFHLWEEIELEPGASFLEAIKHLSSLGEIEIAEPVYKKKRHVFVPNDYWFSEDMQWALNNIGQLDIDHPQQPGQYGIPGWDINISGAWALETGKPTVIVAVLDEGIDFLHSDIAANMWEDIGIQGTNTVAGEHGTHVAGIIAAVTNNGLGMASIAGGNNTSPGVKLMSLDLWGDHPYSTEQLFIYAADNGASISQNSWGYTEPNVYNQADLDGIDYFNTYGGGDRLRGGITIFAAGNDNSSANWYPAYYGYNDPNTLGALAVAAHDNRGVKSDFSNFGPWIDIVAPGTWIMSLAPDGGGMWMSGTSQACPHVSGVAALILSNLRTKITNEQLWDLLTDNTRDIYTTNPTYANQLGSGALDATASLTAAQGYQPVPSMFLYYHHNNTTYNVGMYLDIYAMGDNYLTIQHNSLPHYIKLGLPTDTFASHIRTMKNDNIFALISSV